MEKAAGSPLWLLDVDGVLNAVCGAVPEGHLRKRCMGYSITFNPAIVARIAALHMSGQVEVRWLTTWCHDAPLHIAPALGLPSDLAVEGDEDHKSPARKHTWWKSITAKRLSDAEPNRALIWTDDDLDYSERQGEVDWLRERTGPTLALSPETHTGLTVEHLDRIESFVTRIREAAA